VSIYHVIGGYHDGKKKKSLTYNFRKVGILLNDDKTAFLFIIINGNTYCGFHKEVSVYDLSIDLKFLS